MSAILKQKLIDIANGFTKYGLWKGGGSGGSSALSDMTDGTLTNLQSNDVLKYNGSVWVNDDNLQKQIDTLNSNLNSKIIPISVPNNNKHTYSIGLNGALFISPRNGVIFMSSYQSNKQTIVFGSIPSGLTISKDTDSRLITVENKMGYTLNGSIITT